MLKKETSNTEFLSLKELKYRNYKEYSVTLSLSSYIKAKNID